MIVDAPKILHDELTAAMKERSEQLYSHEDEFLMKVKAVNPIDGNLFALPIIWHSDDEKRSQMLKVSVLAHFARIPAILLVSDTRWLRAEAFSDHFGLKQPTRENIDEWQARYNEIMRGYDFTMRNLPRELWSESIMAAIKGPEVSAQSRFSKYVEGLHDRVQWTDTYENGGEEMENNLIYDYWTDEFIATVKIPPGMMAALRMMAEAFGHAA